MTLGEHRFRLPYEALGERRDPLKNATRVKCPDLQDQLEGLDGPSFVSGRNSLCNLRNVGGWVGTEALPKG